MKKKRSLEVLIVDDEVSMRRILMGMIRSMTSNVIFYEASDGTSAIQTLCEDIGHAPHLAIVDLYMQPMNGVEFSYMVRSGAEGLNRFMPLLLITGDLNRETISAALHAGINGIVPKPCQQNILSRQIKSILAQEVPFVEIEEAFGPGKHYFGPLTPYVREHLIPGRPYHLHEPRHPLVGARTEMTRKNALYS